MIEAENPAGTEFGMERLKSEVYNLRSASISGLLNGLEKALTTYTTPLPVEDDLTLMVVKRRKSAASLISNVPRTLVDLRPFQVQTWLPPPTALIQKWRAKSWEVLTPQCKII
jgi:hypothetical protein